MEGFTVLNRLGQGGQGTTLCVLRKSDNQKFVCKQITCSSIAEGNNALMEAKVLQKINHPGVIKYEDLFLHETVENNYRKLVVCIVMEYCEKGDLHHAINYFRNTFGSMPETQIVKWMHGICRALSHVHEIGILHRDLKPMNIFVDRHGNVKLGDFGLARRFQSPEDLKSRAGTPCYLAPEVLNKEVYAQPSDVWGVGCICLECMQMLFLWERKGLLAVQVMEGPIPIPSSFSKSLRSLVARMLDRAPARRPTSKECLEQFGRMLAAEKQQHNQPSASPAERARSKDKGEAGSGQGSKPEEPSHGVADAIEIAKAAARHAAHVATVGFQAFQKDGESGKKGEERSSKERDEDVTSKVRTVADYEAALEKKRVKPRNNTPTLQTIMAYPLISKDGLTIYISDQDLLAGIELLVKPGMSIDEIVCTALNNKGFFERYVGSQENIEMVKEKMRKVIEDSSIPQQIKPRERKREKVARALEHLKDRTEIKLKETKSAIFHPLKGFVNDMSAALQKLNKSSNDQPRGHDEEVSRNSKSKEAWGGPAEDPHGSRAAALDLLKSMKDESNLNEVVGKVSGSDWEWPVAEAFPGLKSITNEEDCKLLRRHLELAQAARRFVDETLKKLAVSPYLQKPDGTRYKCVIEEDQELAGIAILEYPSGAKYVGGIKNGRPNGMGGLKLDMGGCYVGHFANGIYDGVGHLRMSCDMEFCGNFKAGEFQGWGCLSGTKRVFTQYGTFENGKLLPKPSVGYA
uniref:non-specific serine/threonine protein kinase n=1 Tax=Hanusia phi TaxID=3032 RepID=A0A7S0I3Y1_9CRYP|mmetsp:Transcript_9454/g.21488  ORF Transcript_9454/g.21488 Transcript_9454/m.21488 type:complete len:746 (+) Transcript_9454:300-2537(+)